MSCRLPTLALLTVLLLTGCVERKMLVRSDPPGAAIYLNHAPEPVGTTPADVPFDFYGTYAIRLSKPGYETLVADVDVPAPWYEWPPFDFFSDLVAPVTIRDRLEVHYRLQKVPPRPPEKVLEKELEELGRKALRHGKKMREEVERKGPKDADIR